MDPGRARLLGEPDQGRFDLPLGQEEVAEFVDDRHYAAQLGAARVGFGEVASVETRHARLPFVHLPNQVLQGDEGRFRRGDHAAGAQVRQAGIAGELDGLRIDQEEVRPVLGQQQGQEDRVQAHALAAARRTPDEQMRRLRQVEHERCAHHVGPQAYRQIAHLHLPDVTCDLRPGDGAPTRRAPRHQQVDPAFAAGEGTGQRLAVVAQRKGDLPQAPAKLIEVVEFLQLQGELGQPRAVTHGQDPGIDAQLRQGPLDLGGKRGRLRLVGFNRLPVEIELVEEIGREALTLVPFRPDEFQASAHVALQSGVEPFLVREQILAFVEGQHSTESIGEVLVWALALADQLGRVQGDTQLLLRQHRKGRRIGGIGLLQGAGDRQARHRPLVDPGAQTGAPDQIDVEPLVRGEEDPLHHQATSTRARPGRIVARSPPSFSMRKFAATCGSRMASLEGSISELVGRTTVCGEIIG